MEPSQQWREKIKELVSKKYVMKRKNERKGSSDKTKSCKEKQSTKVGKVNFNVWVC